MIGKDLKTSSNVLISTLKTTLFEMFLKVLNVATVQQSCGTQSGLGMSRPFFKKMCVKLFHFVGDVFSLVASIKLSEEGPQIFKASSPGPKLQKQPCCQQIQTKGSWTPQKPCSLHDPCHLHHPTLRCRFYLGLFITCLR